jgi:hypothetical protein
VRPVRSGKRPVGGSRRQLVRRASVLIHRSLYNPSINPASIPA